MRNENSRNLTNHVVRGSLFILIAILVSKAIDYLNNLFIATNLAPIGFGEFSVVIAVAMWASTVSLLGMNDASVKKLSEHLSTEDKNTIICTAEFFLLIFACLVTIILFLLIPFFALTFDIGLTIAFWIPIVTIVESFREIFNAFIRGFKEFEFLAFTRIINAVSFFALVIIFLFLGWGIIGALLGKILATLLTTFLHAIFLVIKLKTKFVKPKPETFRILFSFGKITYVNYFLVFFRRNAIIVLLAYLWGSYFVGIYSAALLLAGILSFVGIPLTMVLFPSVSSIKERNIVQKIYSEGFQHIIFFTGPITVGLIFFASDLIRIFLGEAYFVDLSIRAVFSILCIAYLIEILLAVPEPTSLGLGRPDLNFWSIFIGSLVALILGYFMTSLFNYMGAAVAYMLSFFVSLLLLMFFLKKKESLQIKTKKVYPILTGVSIMAILNVIGAIIFTALSFLIFIISILLYIVINLKEDVLFDEINFLKTILRKSILNSNI